MKSYDRSLVNRSAKMDDNEYKHRIYSNIYDKNNKVSPRWNTIKENGEKIFRKYLLQLTNGFCAYCGKKINDYEMDVEHFLPEGKFPYLAYCIDNMLPSCKYCNQNIKHDFVPEEIKNLSIVEDCAKDLTTYDYIYDKDFVLNTLCSKSRIIEPTFDNVAENLEFNAEFYSYIYKTDIGRNTIDMFFDNESFIRELSSMSEVVKEAVRKYGECKDIIQWFISREGYEFYYNAFYEYWIKEKEEGRILF